jgi:quercetin dioxygenase-like cupin family protein
VEVLRVIRPRKRLFIAIAAVLALGTCTAVALASAGIGFNPQTLVTGNLDNRIQANTDQVKLQTKGLTDVRVQKIVFDAGGNSGWHHHPGIVIATVSAGVVNFTLGCDSTNYGPGQPAGSVFVEHGDTPGQASSVLGATAFVTFVAPHADPPVFRIEDTAPTCPAGGKDGKDGGDNHSDGGQQH